MADEGIADLLEASPIDLGIGLPKT